jgi:outer membrane protein
VAALFLDAERAGRLLEAAKKEIESLESVSKTVESEVKEGRELPIEARRAALNLARARQLVEKLDAGQETAERLLAVAMGMSANDRARPSREERPATAVPASEEDAVTSALDASQELRQIESQVAAKELEMRGQRASRLPRVDLVAQYALLAKYNNYEQFFNKFQRHNGQLGISLQIPLLAGPGIGAATAQTTADIARLRAQLAATRNRITLDTRQGLRDLRQAESAREVARLDLELAREQVSVLLAQLQEGRTPLRQVDDARVAEAGKWIDFYDAQYAVERARLNILRQTGELLALLK